MRTDEIGNMVRYHRKQGGLTQEGLARLAGVGKTVIYDIEKGKETVQIKTLMNVLEVLNIQMKLVSPLDKNSEND